MLRGLLLTASLLASISAAVTENASAQAEADVAREQLIAEMQRAAVVEQAREELAAVTAALQRRRWNADPVAWVEERLGEELWSKQKEILRSVRDNKETVVVSCHEIGKSFTAARIAGWWLDSHKPGEAAVVTTAPTNRQVRAVLWKEIGRVHRGGLPGRVNQTEWHMITRNARTGIEGEELVAFGFKPADWSPAAFQGIHARFILVIVDEACGVRGDPLWNAIRSLAANDNSKLLLLGNPDEVSTEFFEATKPGSGFNVIKVGAFDTPAFTGEAVSPLLLEHLIGHAYVERMRKRWAPSWQWNAEHTAVLPPIGESDADANPFWLSKVLGTFPTHADPHGLIPMAWIRSAMDRESDPGDPNELGVDVGGGGDSSSVAHRRGAVVRIVHEDHNPDTMQTCGTAIALRKTLGATLVKVDKIGIGAGVVDRAVEQNEPFIGINVGEGASDKSEFANFRAECWWGLREYFESGGIDLDPLDEATAGELVSIRFKRTSSGKIQIESKDEARRRGVPSPNRAESIMLAFATPKHVVSKKGGLVW